MTRKDALRVSDALEAAGISHSITVGIHDSLSPRVHCSVKPHGGALTTTPEQLEAAQAVARASGFRLALIGGEMEFVK